MDKDKQDHLTQQIKTLLDQSVDELDEDSRYQLQMRRAQVLNGKSLRFAKSNWPVMGGFATLASIVVVSVFLVLTKPSLQSNDSQLSSIDAVLFDAETNIDLYEQYEFYVWLSQQESQG